MLLTSSFATHSSISATASLKDLSLLAFFNLSLYGTYGLILLSSTQALKGKSNVIKNYRTCKNSQLALTDCGSRRRTHSGLKPFLLHMFLWHNNL